MSVKAAFALMLAATTMPVTAKTADVIASQGKALAAACKGRDGWTDPAPPAHIFGTTYYVGTCGITVLLITSPKGHVLIDSGPVEAAPFILANIRKLGLRPSDVKLLVGSLKGTALNSGCFTSISSHCLAPFCSSSARQAS